MKAATSVIVDHIEGWNIRRCHSIFGYLSPTVCESTITVAAEQLASSAPARHAE
ncbi:hypothetical protein JOF29_007091 [Kribbella aluminosa]|uniref:Transposase n=1 Tax=Kribbella aluminosa TaxID=416017 RepID=A0ABS4UWH6_9ACTN|nr:hypothetical protein [Kribbella aluminosa]